jgi:streptomycin 6-kinase
MSVSAGEGQLRDYLELWGLSGARLLTGRPTSNVYHVVRAGGPAVLKIFKPIGVKDEAGGAAALRAFNGHGAVRLLAHDAGAQLLEYASGDDLTALVRQGRDEEATVILADVMKALHGASIDQPLSQGLIPLRRRFESLFRAAAREQHGLYAQAAAVAERLLSDPIDVRVLHGDMHHENVRHSEERGWLAIDPKGLWGERTFDAANVLLNPMGLPDLVLDEGRYLKTVDLLADRMKLDRARLMAFSFAFSALSACWSIEDGQDPSLAMGVARMAAERVRV